MFVYRIEDDKGVGMYHSSKVEGDEYCVPVDYDRHPTPFDDSLLCNKWREMSVIDRKSHIFGFSSVEQLRNWIYNDLWLKNLHEEGFVISVFSVERENVIEGHTQALFVRDKATSWVSLSIIEFFNL